MAIRNCRVIGIEGTHGTGKSTLVQALAASWKAQHVHAAGLAELARKSPFVEEVVIHRHGEFDLSAELHLLGSHVAAEQLLARYHAVLICDRTVANILGYSRLLLGKSADEFSMQMLESITAFCRTYSRQYDAVFYLSDLYDLTKTRDPFRPTDLQFQREADRSIREACAEIGLRVTELPRDLRLEQKVSWILDRVRI